MTQLPFAPFDLSLDKAVTVGDHSVTIRHDDCPENPWLMWDLQTPMIYCSLDRGCDLLEFGGSDLKDFFTKVKPIWVSRHWRKIAGLLGYTMNQFDSDSRDRVAQYGGGLPQARHDLAADTLCEMVKDSGWTACNAALDTLAGLYRLLGWSLLHTQRNGFCQGDSVSILLVATPDFIAACGGGTCASPEALKAEADLFGSWAFGEVYGFEVADATGEVVDSCYGFYGPYYTAQSGILDAITVALDSVSRPVSVSVSI
jgi:hypothetical protein